MSLLGFCQWLSGTALSTGLRESPWDYYILGAIHMAGIGLFGGMVLLGNLRVLGLAMRKQRIAEVLDGLRPWKVAGFCTVAASGMLLAISEPLDCYRSISFRLLLTLLVLLGANGLVLRRHIYRCVETPAVRFSAGVSLVLLAALVLAGRGIAFF